MKVQDPLIELLAIKLYEHDQIGGSYPGDVISWSFISEEERQLYRDMATGKQAFGHEETGFPSPRRG